MAEEAPSPILHQTCDPSPCEEDDVLSIASSFEPPRQPPTSHPCPSTSHLTPCSWQDFLQYDFVPEHHVDLVSGFLVRRSVMADSEHQEIISHLASLINFVSLLVFAYFTPPTKVVDYAESSNSNSPQRKIPGKREPDIALSRQDEESSDRSASPAKKKIKFSEEKPPSAVIEVTSKSTRREDLYEKWAAYARSGFPLYIILDRPSARVANGVLDDSPTVIVGSLDQISGWQRCPFGDPEQSPIKTRNYGNDNTGPARHYYRKIYKGDEIVDCPYLKDLGLTARQLLDKRFLRKRYQQIKSQKEKAAVEKRQAEERAEKAEHEKRKAKERAEKAEHEKRKAQERADHAERKAKERAEKAEKRAKKAEERAEKAELLLREKRKKGKASRRESR